MRIIQTKGIVNNGQVSIKVPPEFKNGEIDIVLVAKDEPDEFEIRHQMMIDKGYDTPEKIMDLIKQIKLEMLKEKGR
jgi:hypothetical protein